MPEEADPNSMTDASIQDNDTARAYESTQEWKGLDVFDVEGTRVGRVTRCFVGDGDITYCDVRLDAQVTRAMGMDEDIARFRPEMVTDVSAEGVRLNTAAAQVVDPGHAREGRGGGGSDSFPRRAR